MPTDPFHYTGILTELTGALQHALQASDWAEHLGASAEADSETRQIQERGNLRLALTRCKNAFTALRVREENLSSDLLLGEHATEMRMAPEIARAIGLQPVTPLPPDLQPE